MDAAELAGFGGGEGSGGRSLNGLVPLMIKMAEMRVRRYVSRRKYRIADKHDFQAERHYLLPEGVGRQPAVIDIGLVKDTSGG